ncbi:TetR/AcrR family transcriptional regulator [Roseovarius aestuariivivens]|uniref:TetR/AcrR family transcriptional regulator n=1 Tax=Roseovarius aestuariivivens TaxID=1888910 RepID=UPI0010813F3E|nr:TetR/AcrR family transcriptional regulator [Roseovarius aestuariivivens]
MLITGPDTSSDKKAAILSATTKLLISDGLNALSFEAVAAKAGLSRQLVRYYYPSLDALMIAVCDHLGAAYRDLLIAGIVDLKQVERLPFFLDFFFDLADGHKMPDNLEAYDAFLAYSVTSEAFRERLCSTYKTLGDVMVHELKIAYPDLPGAACKELSCLFVPRPASSLLLRTVAGSLLGARRVFRRG